jgi:hypothetical protein
MSGHHVTCDAEEDCNESQSQAVRDAAQQEEQDPDYWTDSIKKDFGVKMKKGNIVWDLANLQNIYYGLRTINNALNGMLQSMIGGTEFTLWNDGNSYFGNTLSTGIQFHISTSPNFPLPGINIYHEVGHLLDNVPATKDVFSGPLGGTKPSWVDSQGFVDEHLLLGKVSQPVQSKYIIDENGNRTEAFHPNEYWADSFANYVAGNINLSEHSGGGQAMYDYVNQALSPYTNP